MALGKYSRVDGRQSSSSYCSKVSLVVFVAFCLVGVWMMTSSSVVPVQNLDVSSQESKNEIRTQVSENNESSSEDNPNPERSTSNDIKPKQFEDNPGDLPEDVMKGESNASLAAQEEKNYNSQENFNISEKTNEDNQEDKSEEKNGNQNEVEDKSEEASESEANKEPEKKDDGESKTHEKDSNFRRTKTDNEEGDSGRKGGPEEVSGDDKSDPDGDRKSEKTSSVTKDGDEGDSQTEEKDDQKKDKKSEKQEDADISKELLFSGVQSELLNENSTKNGSFSTQAAESMNEKEAQALSEHEGKSSYNWKLCNVTAGPDYIPCLDNLAAIRSLKTTTHYEHRERHCPQDPPTCLVPLPEGYQRPIEWPTSRGKIWYHNVPHTKLAEIKGHQNWVKVSGEYLTFPGGGTQFKHGALHYIDFIQEIAPGIAWGNRSRVVLDVGCGVASFGGFLFDRDVLTMSLAPKDEHEAQVQFALERGIPAISAVMGTKRLPFPGRVFDVVHCARCRVPWHIEGGKLLLELNRLLRPGGLFVWSATPIYRKVPEDVEIWEAMKKLTNSMCWELVSIRQDKVNEVGVAVYQKPTSNECYKKRSQLDPQLCKETDDPDAAWDVPLQTCMHKVPVVPSERGSQWPAKWPERLVKPPFWLLSSQVGVYGKSAPEDFTADYDHWKRVVTKSYIEGMGINWSKVRNVMDMRSIYGGFAAALKDINVWVMNVVSIDAPDTLPIIYERGLFGIYHDWCESLSTYPRSYDLLHADHLFSRVLKRCNFMALVAEVDRILRPDGKVIIRDKVDIINQLETIFKSMHWKVCMIYSKENEGLLCVQKSMRRPKQVETIKYAIA